MLKPLTVLHRSLSETSSTRRCASGASASFLVRKTADTPAPAVKMVAASLPASEQDIDTFLADYQSATELAASMEAQPADASEGARPPSTCARFMGMLSLSLRWQAPDIHEAILEKG